MNLTHVAVLCDETGKPLSFHPGENKGAAEGPALTALANYLVDHPVDPTIPDVPSPTVKLFAEVPPAEPTVRWPANQDNVGQGIVPPMNG